MNDEDHRYEAAGSPLEVALLNFMVDNGIPIQDRFIQVHHQNEVKLKAPFCSLRKCMTVVNRLENQMIRVVMKGAPEVIVPLTTRILNANN
jgi:magnesium-transporting ATPase (P-type)